MSSSVFQAMHTLSQLASHIRDTPHRNPPPKRSGSDHSTTSSYVHHGHANPPQSDPEPPTLSRDDVWDSEEAGSSLSQGRRDAAAIANAVLDSAGFGYLPSHLQAPQPQGIHQNVSPRDSTHSDTLTHLPLPESSDSPLDMRRGNPPSASDSVDIDVITNESSALNEKINIPCDDQNHTENMTIREIIASLLEQNIEINDIKRILQCSVVSSEEEFYDGELLYKNLSKIISKGTRDQFFMDATGISQEDLQDVKGKCVISSNTMNLTDRLYHALICYVLKKNQKKSNGGKKLHLDLDNHLVRMLMFEVLLPAQVYVPKAIFELNNLKYAIETFLNEVTLKIGNIGITSKTPNNGIRPFDKLIEHLNISSDTIMRAIDAPNNFKDNRILIANPSDGSESQVRLTMHTVNPIHFQNILNSFIEEIFFTIKDAQNLSDVKSCLTRTIRIQGKIVTNRMLFKWKGNKQYALSQLTQKIRTSSIHSNTSHLINKAHQFINLLNTKDPTPDAMAKALYGLFVMQSALTLPDSHPTLSQ